MEYKNQTLRSKSAQKPFFGFCLYSPEMRPEKKINRGLFCGELLGPATLNTTLVYIGNILQELLDRCKLTKAYFALSLISLLLQLRFFNSEFQTVTFEVGYFVPYKSRVFYTLSNYFFRVTQKLMVVTIFKVGYFIPYCVEMDPYN